jgi:hypothetical protein
MKGLCLCGAVTVTAPDNPRVSVCHCGMCRRWSGGPNMVVHCGPDVKIDGEEFVTAYRSSDWAERGFCLQCGTSLYYRIVPSNEYILSAGLFQDQVPFELKAQIFIDDKPAFYAFVNETETLTGSEVFAKFAPGA